MSYPPPKYFKDHGQVSAAYRPHAKAPDLSMRPGGTQVSYLATDASTAGEFGLYRWDFGPNPSGPDPHFHKTISESFFILSGTVHLFDGARWVEATAGDFLYVPQGGIHAFRNEPGEGASMLLLFAPGATREAYFEELAKVAAEGGERPEEFWAELLARHDQYPA
jgi:mannose-6-phosphate isomerase-like protein (cupin superfamily)